MLNAMKNVLQENNANNGYSPFSKTCLSNVLSGKCLQT